MTTRTEPSSHPCADPNAIYALGYSLPETNRLYHQADELAADLAAALDKIGLASGHSANDIGRGPRGALQLLAERVSPGGRVVGVDADAVHVKHAREFASDYIGAQRRYFLAAVRSHSTRDREKGSLAAAQHHEALSVQG